MKIAVRGGHSLDIRGASSFLDEVNEDRKIKDAVIKYLKQMGHEVLDVTPSKSGSSGSDLNYGVSKANTWAADYFYSIHLNAGGGKGTEVLYYKGSSKGNAMATNIVKKIEVLGFVNRGAKADTRGLYELRHTNMTANIVEVCFVDTKSDADLYNSIGVNKIAKAITEGITGQTIAIENKHKDAVNYCLEFRRFFNKVTQTLAPISEDGKYGSSTQKALDRLYSYIKQGRKYKYCLEFQKWYNNYRFDI
ncbi:N-acetylmuramoyl-L-alanine amidase [Clostridium sp. ZS2-4]|uniref:N-acetylmuramoyl-L-alanine amidase n=1 Tax=Clostridium sp. ZS2-4 TaxID=2987703 RepID=UPI00227ABB9D|nr:N-acetylmuramoyl-L-alanine amidase [Clostridium sp. ZS2-4]MCY6355366.1 N-acetylmuramoyl-L-alanine amidase [Clostridium sp. ZS2-4]